MKITGIVILLFGTLPVIGQVYFPLQKDSAVWSIKRTDYNFTPPFETYYTHFFALDGDTIINDHYCNKLKSNNIGDAFNFISPVESFYNPETANYWGGLYETNKKVFLIQKEDTASKLMYDFSMAIGDTVTINYMDALSGTFKFILDTVILEPVNLEGDLRNHYYLHSDDYSHYDIWIEGIGSIRGFYQLDWLATWQYDLICYFENDNQLTGTDSECFLNTNISNPLKPPVKFRVYPTINKGEFKLEYNGAPIQTELKLIDLRGRVVCKKNIYLNNTISIDFLNTAPGCYFLIADDRFENSQMVIIQ